MSEISKSALIVDTPKNCYHCHVYSDQCRSITGRRPDYNLIDSRPDWCPLRPIPEPATALALNPTAENMYYDTGWNDCLEELLGQENT